MCDFSQLKWSTTQQNTALFCFIFFIHELFIPKTFEKLDVALLAGCTDGVATLDQVTHEVLFSTVYLNYLSIPLKNKSK